ncbi:MAG TPA: amidase family protein [Ilumatobacteraceae bacterium]|nr:amidase family protein [Ilumatobacteraceae bacterium]
MDEYADLDATALGELVRRGDVKPIELVDEAIARTERLNPALNAVIHRQFERARRDAADSPLDGAFPGVPFLLKDYKAREAGEPYHMGVRTLRDLDFRPRTDSALALRFRSTGLIPIGRTNTPEIAAMGTTEPVLYGPTHNPWDLERSPGGSSGGSAAAVAARIVPAAHANDISGSIRIPAALCGLVGLKPTRGRALTSDVIDPPVGMNSEGVVSRTVRDTAALVDAITATSPWWPAPPLPGPLVEELTREPEPLRIGLWTTAFNGAVVDPGCAAAAETCAATLESMGHHVEVGAPAELSSDELWEAARLAMGASAAAEAAAWTDRIGHPLGEDDLEPRSWSMVCDGARMSAPELLAVIHTMQRMSAGALRWWDEYDVLVTPTTAGPGSPLGEYLRSYVSGLGSAFTRPLNVTGQPAISLPLGWPDDGLPRGVQLVGGYGREDILIRLSARLEEAMPWAQHTPEVAR